MKKQGYEQSTLFQGGSHASLFQLPGSEEARMMTVTSGQKCSGLCRKSGPLGLLVKMLLESSIWHSTLRLLIWKPRVTPSKHLYFQLVPSVPRIGGTDVQLSPAPNTMGYLPQISLEASGKRTAGNRRPPEKSISLGILACLEKYKTMVPTPTTGAGLCGGSGNYQQLLKLEQYKIITEKERKSMSRGNGGQLNPVWVEWLMGFPIGWTDLNA